MRVRACRVEKKGGESEIEEKERDRERRVCSSAVEGEELQISKITRIYITLSPLRCQRRHHVSPFTLDAKKNPKSDK